MKITVFGAGLAVLCSTVLFAQSFRVDFSKWTDDPLLKTKFGVYQTPLAQADCLVLANNKLAELNIQHYRYEFGWGKDVSLEFEQITKEGETIKYKIDRAGNDVDRVFAPVFNSGITPLFVPCYAPAFLQKGHNWQSMVSNLEEWKAINRKYAAHWKERGHPSSGYEIWNEPDLYNIFFVGTKDDYTKLYKYGTQGIREGNPDAVVGGMALWSKFDYLSYWLNYVKDFNIPVDFVSCHAYDSWDWMVQRVRSELMSKGSSFNNAPIYLTEWTSFDNTDPSQVTFNCPIEKSVAAMRFFRDAQQFLKVHDLARVYWSQWRDTEIINENGEWQAFWDKFGLTTTDGLKKPLFNAFKLYGMMPVDRYVAEPLSENNIHVMASRDEHNAAVACWNTSGTDAEVTIDMTGLPFSSGSLQTYRIDKQHGSIRECGHHCEGKLTDGSPTTLSASSTTWQGKVPGEGVVVLLLDDNSGQSLLKEKKLGTFVRHLQWFPQRQLNCYAYFDPKTWIARLGMGDNDYAYAGIGNVIDGLKDNIHVQIDADGAFSNLDENSLFGIRLDYQASDGSYAKSVLLHGGVYNHSRTKESNWGTNALPTETVKIEHFVSEEGFDLKIGQYAPDNWNGQRVILSFEMQNLGRGSRARVVLSDQTAQ